MNSRVANKIYQNALMAKQAADLQKQLARSNPMLARQLMEKQALDPRAALGALKSMFNKNKSFYQFGKNNPNFSPMNMGGKAFKRPLAESAGRAVTKGKHALQGAKAQAGNFMEGFKNSGPTAGGRYNPGMKAHYAGMRVRDNLPGMLGGLGLGALGGSMLGGGGKDGELGADAGIGDRIADYLGYRAKR